MYYKTYPKTIKKIIIKRALLKDANLFLKQAREINREGIWLILLDDKYYVDDLLIKVATIIAWRDFIYGMNKAKKFEIQVLMRLLCLDQINKINERNPLVDGKTYIVIIVSDGDVQINFEGLSSLKFFEINGIKESDYKKIEFIKRFFDITDEEIGLIGGTEEQSIRVIVKLIMERMALYSLE